MQTMELVVRVCLRSPVASRRLCADTSRATRRRRGRSWLRLTGSLVALGAAGAGYKYWRADFMQRRKVRVRAEGVVRFFRSLLVGLTISLDYWWTLRGLEEDSPEYNSRILPCHQRAADRIVAGALKNGGLYIKLGQGLGSFNQVLPREYIDTLKTLQDMALAREYRELDILFMEDFEKTPDQLFKSFSPEPVAAASLAQVFKATTHDNKEVAVKAQYIDLRDRYDGDIWTLKLLLRIVAYMHPRFTLAWVLDELKGTLAEELDFEHEGHNLEHCARDLRHLPYVYVPKVDWGLTTKRVLTAEWINGCKATDRKAIEKMGLRCADVAHKVITVFSHQIFHTGFVHADPHPGNVLVRPSPLGGAEIVLLDHGLYMPLQEKTRLSLCTIWKAIILHDVPTLERECKKLGVKEYELFAVMLTGRTLQSHRSLFGISSSQMTREDWKAVKGTFVKFDEVVEILRALPTSMLLIFRNINIVRSVNRELGTPVNRFNIMARSAIEGASVSTNPKSWTFKARISSWAEATVFDLKLMYWSLRIWCTVKFLSFLRLIGQLPKEAQVLEQLMQS